MKYYAFFIIFLFAECNPANIHQTHTEFNKQCKTEECVKQE